MNYSKLGLTERIEQYRSQENFENFELGRIISEHKERYIIKTPESEFLGELLGNLRYTAESRSDLPVVGDWVAFTPFDDDKGIIHAVYPRYSILERKATGQKGMAQPIAANVDFSLIVQSANRDFNLNRLDRYLTICYNAGINPIVVLSKTDLVDQNTAKDLVNKIKSRHKNIPVTSVNNQALGYEQVNNELEPNKTYCLLGSSGVGKSTLLNALLGEQVVHTAEISTAVNKGKHTTTHRELYVLPNGSLLIDNPGMREIGITNASSGLETTFQDFQVIEENCKYPDCTHMHEEGCAVLEAVALGKIDQGIYNSFVKLEKERMHYESDAQERKKKDKNLGKIIKQMKKQGYKK